MAHDCGVSHCYETLYLAIVLSVQYPVPEGKQ